MSNILISAGVLTFIDGFHATDQLYEGQSFFLFLALQFNEI